MPSSFNVHVGEIAAPEVSTSGANQTVEIGSGVNQTIEIGGNEGSYEGGYEGGRQQEYGNYGSDSDSSGYLDQVVSQDMGSLSQPRHMAAQAEERNQEHPQERQASPRHMREDASPVSHYIN